jgi:hypothetical protein
MPSSHSATVTALAVAIGFQEGTASSVFAIAVILACIVRISSIHSFMIKYSALFLISFDLQFLSLSPKVHSWFSFVWFLWLTWCAVNLCFFKTLELDTLIPKYFILA